MERSAGFGGRSILLDAAGEFHTLGALAEHDYRGSLIRCHAIGNWINAWPSPTGTDHFFTSVSGVDAAGELKRDAFPSR